MNEELLEKLEKLENEIKEIRKRYGQFHDYKLVSTIFDKFGLDNIELDYDEIDKNKSIYMVEHNHENKKVTVRKLKEEDKKLFCNE